MTREFSAGGIVFNNQNQVLLTQNRKGDWQFPKGHIKKAETIKQAALREVREEGGVEAKIIEKIGDSKYIINFNGHEIFKTVTLFLMDYLSGDIKNHDHEVVDSQWLDAKKALETLTFNSDKILLEKALRQLADQND